MKMDSVKKHEALECHIYSAKCFANRKKAVGSSEAGACLSQLTAAQNDNVAHYKHVWMCK